MEGGGGGNGKEKEGKQDGTSVHSPCRALRSPADTLSEKQSDSEVELELRFSEALAIYPPVRLRGIHRHFVIYGLMEYLRRRLDRHFSPDEVLQLMNRFYNIAMLEPKEETEILHREEDFNLPQSYFAEEESEILALKFPQECSIR